MVAVKPGLGMEIYRDWRGLPAAARGAAVALGNFDGVHLGHAAVLRAAHAARPDRPLAVLTFEPHPREYFRPQDPPFRLMLAAERAAALAALGVTMLYEMRFDDAFSHLTAARFVTEILHQGLGAAELACGPDFAFGHRRGGDVGFLAAAAERLGMGLAIVPKLADAEGPISSTRIRRLLQDGYPERAAALLGRPHAIRGEVMHGDARGRTIGFPTANIYLRQHLEPARGVYAVTARLPGGGTANGVANIGQRPTVDGQESRLEAHLFDYDGDLYGAELVVALRHFLREERKFPDFEALRAQIVADAAAARALLDKPAVPPNPLGPMSDADSATDYKATVFLPRTEFPMRGELPKREPLLLRRWEAMGLWARLRAAAAGRPPFILHDGPPYANGNLHIGHALNKIHKDVINRAQQMAGRDANYIPGWDCHGLPIEWKIEEQYRKAGRDKDQVPVLEFRRECREYAQHWMDVQAEEFKRLGIAGDWANRYATMDFISEAAIAAEIGKFLMNGALYRGLRPVLWSPVEKTALAEAEVEYHDKKDTAIWVRFKVRNATSSTDQKNNQNPNGALKGASVVIWTTTPWTIPGNRAVAFNPVFDYDVIRVLSAQNVLLKVGERLVVASDLLKKFVSDVGITDYEVVHQFGKGVLGTLPVFLEHPLIRQGYNNFGEQEIPGVIELLPANFVTTEAGNRFRPRRTGTWRR